MRATTIVALGTGLLLAASPAFAGLTEEEIASLGGPKLTPIGAERAGNAEGTIPEWTGGITEPPPGWKVGDRRIDLFKNDKILFSIDKDNVDQHKDKLSPGQVALINTYGGYRMDIYPSRRTCAYPEDDYRNAKVNARVSTVDEDCFLQGGLRSPVFPIPKTGCQLIQNGKLSTFNGLRGYDRYEATIVPTKSGAFVPIKRRQQFYFTNHDPKFTSFDQLDGIWTKSMSNSLAPPKVAGEITLVHAEAGGHLRAWTYNPGQRRVRRAPKFEYDNPVNGWQGLVTIDQVNGYVGAADRYDWTMVGKKEMYIPYNAAKFSNPDMTYKDLIQARFPKREAMRYELHRVWVVEGNVRKGKRHIMPRRTMYLDEDSWIITATDAYDTRGELWRVQETIPQLLYEVPSCINNGTIFYDLVAGRYLVSPVFNEEQEADYLAGHTGKIDNSGFAPNDLRKIGRR